jgi:hypothetical protein
MKTKDSLLLEKAYLSINQKLQSVPSDLPKKEKSEDEIEVPSELKVSSPEEDTIENAEDRTIKITSEVPSAEHPTEPLAIQPSPSGCPCCSQDGECGCTQSNNARGCSLDDCCDEHGHDINVDNLNSIRESVIKIAMICSMGAELESWQQQKIAIAMDNLAEVARRLK